MEIDVQPLPVTAVTSYLKAADGSTLWDGAAFDGEYLCFRPDGSFVGAVSAANLASCRQGASRLPLLLSLPDVNASVRPDVAVLRGPAPIVVEILERAGGAPVRQIPFFDTGSGFTVRASLLLPDSDNDGIPELAVLAIRDSDGRGCVQLRNLAGPALTRNIVLNPGFTPIDITSVGDADSNGIADVGVLAMRNSDGRGVVLTRNLLDLPGSLSMVQAAGAQPLRILAVPDADGNGTPEYAVLSRRRSDGRAMVQISDVSDSKAAPATLYLGKRTPVDMAVVDDADGNGVPEIAVLLVNNTGKRNLVQLINAAGTPGDLRLAYTAGHTALALRSVDDADANGKPELAVLSVRDADGAALMETRNAAGAAQRLGFRLSSQFLPLGMEVFPDLDANGSPELGTLGVRLSNGRMFVFTRNAAGAALPLNYTFAP